ncbi:formylglycine-generating enzyme family protein [Muriicola sp.]|uniref:formylglycine-generating enzyme family protein n=1 Tax=Muriicola sp. TaxID=2020856 RepID=UPI003566EFCA
MRPTGIIPFFRRFLNGPVGPLALFCLMISCGQGPGAVNMQAKAPEGMQWVEGAEFMRGARPDDPMAMASEKPAHLVRVDGFYIDRTEVTNARFRAFVKETGYITTAEKPVDWEAMKKTLPPGMPKPTDSVLQPGSMVFTLSKEPVSDMGDISQWWRWQVGANWKHPQGPDSSIEGKDHYPVVHISYEDALAYCAWAGRRLPTEAEWELAARGTSPEGRYTWGDDPALLPQKANTWQGIFPVRDEGQDGFNGLAPVASYPENARGLYDMAGNVWEWTQDTFHPAYYTLAARKVVSVNPGGAEAPFNPLQPEKVIKGGSFLCNASYCAGFRISARMGMTHDSSTDHVGFRTVADANKIK